jgi:hypothetical protein
MIPKQPESKPIQLVAPKKSAMRAPAPAPAPLPEMKPPISIDELLKDIKSTVLPPPGNGPPPPEKIRKNKPGSTGKNSVVIKL